MTSANPAFEVLLEGVAKLPAMYVGRCCLRSVSDYLSGYDHALRDVLEAESPLSGWQPWIECRFLISSPAWHWTRILLHVYGRDEDALAALPGLYREFLLERAARGVLGIEAERRRRLLAERGGRSYEPPSTGTTLEA